MIEKRCKHTNSKYKDSHQKNAKSMHKHLTRSSVPDTIFSDKRQATSDKRQATSDKRQATKRHKFRPNKFKYQLLKPRPKTSRRPKTAFLSLGFFHTPFNKTATDAKR